MTQVSPNFDNLGALATTAQPSKHPRIKNPAMLLPGAMQGIQTVMGAIYKSGVPAGTLELCHLRASQINGCHLCIATGLEQAKRAGETEERLAAISTWRDSTVFTEPERAALELAESVTRLADCTDPVPDVIWQRATRHFDEQSLAALVLMIGLTNAFNRFNVSTRQVAAEWG